MTGSAPRPPAPRPSAMVLFVVLSTVAVVGLVSAAPPWLGAPAAVLWVLLVPGLPWAARMQLDDHGDTLAVGVAISLALAAVVGGGMAAFGAWSPFAGVLVLLLVSLGALVPGLPALRHHDLRRYQR